MKKQIKRLAIILPLLALCGSIDATAKSKIVQDFNPVCDSLLTLNHERTGISGKLIPKAIMKRGGYLDFYFTESLGEYPWHKEDVKWFRSTLRSLFPEDYKKYRLGDIYSKGINLNKLVTPELSNDGRPVDSRHKVRHPSEARQIVEKIGAQEYSKGLNGRHIALWQSHGRYYSQKTGMWMWQRACLFQTCEDMYTQGYVLPYLVPMLENAGAYVFLPRERDIQKNEVIVDNDPSCEARVKGTYKENGRWADAGDGFADIKAIYNDLENPFRLGTARKISTLGPNAKATASAVWTPVIPERGEYAVYISYKSLPNSTSSAHYTVKHLGGTSEFIVNQKIGGGTWIYLGTFEFAQGSEGNVTIDNITPEGHKMEVGATITADAVRFGGGMGNISRAEQTSGLPRYAEGARYWAQWAGADSTVYYLNNGEDDYKDDFMMRGEWVNWISGGSRSNPDRKNGLGIPLDLSFAFHTDAGTRPDDEKIGTLAIYTSKSDGKTKYPTGEDRQTSRMYSDLVQTQITNDLRAEYDSLWTRRSIWNKSYRESRTPQCPAMLLELLSHQNFADMKLGLDPTFRFTVSRAVYKGMLKYLSYRYGREYVVQPLPVSSVGVCFGENGKAVLSWTPVDDPHEPTAAPKGYIVYKRIGNGGFDNGTIVMDCRYETSLIPGEILSFKVAAYNDGGEGFPSEVVSIGLPSDGSSGSKVLIVNNFNRVSGPVWFDTPEYAGLNNGLDSGVPDKRDITFIGEMYDFRRSQEWKTDERQGFGASYSDLAGNIVAGNTSDYPYIHGKAMLEAGHAFYSCSNEKFTSDSLFAAAAWTVDLICGKQVTTPVGRQRKYTVFPYEMQAALRNAARKGTNLIVSGAYIGTDLDDCIYPIASDSTYRADATEFAKEVLGYEFISNQASRRGAIIPVANEAVSGHPALDLTREMNPYVYCVESPDAIAPAYKSGQIIYRYSDSRKPAGVTHEGEGYRCISFGFPIEALSSTEHIERLISTTLEYLKK